MNLEQFQAEIRRLSQAFGEKNYPPARVSLLYKQLSYIGPSEFSRVVDRLITSRSRPPLLDDFNEALTYIRGDVDRNRTCLENSNGLRISTEIGCDRCHQYFTFVGYAPDLDLRQLCPKCIETFPGEPKKNRATLVDSPNNNRRSVQCLTKKLTRIL